VLVRVRQIEYQRPFPRHEEQVNPHQALEDPSGSGVLDRMPFLVGKCRLMLPERCAYAMFQGGVDQQTHGHDHHKSHDPLRFFPVERRGQKERVFEKPTATFGILLAFIRCQDCLRGQGAVVECIGGETNTIGLRHKGLTDRER
jgi:hypothetical protein